ncbi:MAG: hypothetical protein J5X22_19075 [Candidatus Accumulibacter sp.]|uniref:hypothetical protein n=1 Tax=Accumulibacter sp. TaxID=2053492 RepID=UPI001AC6D1E1|nr:hypothetical protein [Accumulibacter sp.]MBN8518375.1 hypothetical protein [Accumulibacter sp.]MBO3712517.1 hypothetical protein [Accumulibacter sp.]
MAIRHTGRVLANELLVAWIQAQVVDVKVVQARQAPAKPSVQHSWRQPFFPAATAVCVHQPDFLLGIDTLLVGY